MMLIRCENAAFGYENIPVVKKLDFSVESGDYLCVIGENGSGKSTLIKGLLGLLKPYQGQVVLGESLNHGSIGYLPQQTENQKDFPATVWEVVLSGCLSGRGMWPFYSAADKKKAHKQLETLRITELKRISYRDLSGGQKQRVLLARALCATDKLLILDEPTTGLDPFVTEELYTILQELNKEHGTAIIMVSHDIQNAVKYADKILHVEQEMKFYGTADEYMDSELGALFLGKGGRSDD